MDKLNVRYSDYANREYIVTNRRHFKLCRRVRLPLLLQIKVICYRPIKGSLICID